LATFALVPGAGGVSILVAQSLGGFTAAPVCAKARVRMLVFVNAMIPLPGETAGEWWGDTGWEEARVAAARRGGYSPSFELATYFLNDLPPALVEQGEAHERPEADVVFGEPCRFEAWPAVPIYAVAGRDDRFFPLEFQRRVAQERLQVSVDELPGGHLLALANPRGLTDQLLGYLGGGTPSSATGLTEFGLHPLCDARRLRGPEQTAHTGRTIDAAHHQAGLCDQGCPVRRHKPAQKWSSASTSRAPVSRRVRRRTKRSSRQPGRRWRRAPARLAVCER
jgi:hypothetical protein